MPNRYTFSSQDGLFVEPLSGSKENGVEIIGPNGRIIDSLSNVTDLRDAKPLADPGDTIRVLPGEYTTRNLLKDGVDWYFQEGAKVDNEGLSDGAFFENVGAHNSPSGSISSRIEGKGEFKYFQTSSGSAFLSTGSSSDTDLYIEAKKFTVAEGATSTGFAVHAAGTVEAKIDEVVYEKTNTSGIETGAFLVSCGTLNSEDPGADIELTVDRLDARKDESGKPICVLFENSVYSGQAKVDIEKMITGDSSSYIASSQATAGTNSTGAGRIKIKEHVGTVPYGWFQFSGDLDIILDQYNVNIRDEDGTSALAWSADNAGTYYVLDSNITHPTDGGSRNTVDGTGDIYLLGEVSEGSISLGSNVNVVRGELL